MMILFMQIYKKFSLLLLLLSPWIIYAKRTAVDIEKKTARE